MFNYKRTQGSETRLTCKCISATSKEEFDVDEFGTTVKAESPAIVVLADWEKKFLSELDNYLRILVRNSQVRVFEINFGLPEESYVLLREWGNAKLENKSKVLVFNHADRYSANLNKFLIDASNAENIASLR